MELSFAVAGLDDPTVRRLTKASIDEIDSHYDGRPGSGAPPVAADFAAPVGAFIVAALDGEAIGCGGLSRFDEETCEIRITDERSLCFERKLWAGKRSSPAASSSGVPLDLAIG